MRFGSKFESRVELQEVDTLPSFYSLGIYYIVMYCILGMYGTVVYCILGMYYIVVYCILGMYCIVVYLKCPVFPSSTIFAMYCIPGKYYIAMYCIPGRYYIVVYYIAGMKYSDMKVKWYKQLLGELPAVNYATLKAMIRHLAMYGNSLVCLSVCLSV